jgi:hypothetical protein
MRKSPHMSARRKREEVQSKKIKEKERGLHRLLMQPGCGRCDAEHIREKKRHNTRRMRGGKN